MPDASWQPDPSGRHQYRWWNGTGWTETVADNGVTSTDPLPSLDVTTVIAPAPTPPQPPAPAGAASPSPPVASPTAPVYSPPGGAAPLPSASVPDYLQSGGPAAPPPGAGGGSALKWLLPLAAVIVVGAVLFFVLGGGDDDGGGDLGVFESDLPTEESIVVRTLDLRRGDAVRIRVEPGNDDLDVRWAIVVDDDVAEAYAGGLFALVADEGFFTDVDEIRDNLFTDAEDFFSEGQDLPGRVAVDHVDRNGDGEPETEFLVALADGTYSLVVGSYSGTGGVRIVAERFDGEVPLSGFTDVDNFLSDDAFFTDDDFFSDEDPFTPGG